MELASLAQLERSHRRHDEVMAGLLEAARRLAAGRPDEGDLERVHEAVAYFGRAVTRHFLDEEGSVFPRLSTRRPELAAELAALSAEHPEQIELQNAVAAAAREVDGEVRPITGKALLDAATRLADVHRSHVSREDELFRIAQEALTAEDDAEITAEMETRRDREENGHRGGRGMRRGGGGGGGGGGGRGGGGGGGGGGGRRRREASENAQVTLEKAPIARARASTVPASPAARKKASNGARAAAKAQPAAKARSAAKAGSAKTRPAAKARSAAKAGSAKARPAAGKAKQTAARAKKPLRPAPKAARPARKSR